MIFSTAGVHTPASSFHAFFHQGIKALFTPLPILQDVKYLTFSNSLDYQPDGYSSKAFAVFGLPLILLAVHLVCVVATNIDPKSKDINKKIFRVLLWICPLVSLFVSTVIYGYSLGYDFDMSYLCGILIGVLYLVLGNFLPTVKPNYTIGFRIPWTLNDPDNWYHTHRFGGKCMVIGGIIMILTSPLQNMWILLAAAIVPYLLPAIYSYLYYRKS